MMSYNKRILNLNLILISIFLFISTLIHAPGRAFASAARDPFLNQNDDGELTDGLCAMAADIIHGFTCKEYKVTTNDGYILSVQRIFSEVARPLEPVILQHGVLADGMTWLMNSAEQSLAMILAASKYDVWISNVRGTRFSSQHTSLQYEDSEYWDWTFDELSSQDLPAVVKFICDETRQKIHYIGHSLGTLMALVSLSEGNLDDVRSVVMLSPIAFLYNINSLLARAGADSFLGDFVEATGLAVKFDPKGLDVVNFTQGLCSKLPYGCSSVLTALSGNDCCLNETTIGSFLDNHVQPTSTKNMVHLSQNVRMGSLSKYDYGVANNFVQYGSVMAPAYNLSNIPSDLPLLMSYGGQDAMSDVKDVETLFEDALKTHDTEKKNKMFIEKYAHMDFVMSTDANKLVYANILDFFRNITN